MSNGEAKESVREKIVALLDETGGWMEGEEIAAWLGKKLGAMQGTLTGMDQRHEVETRQSPTYTNGKRRMMYKKLSTMSQKEFMSQTWTSPAVVAEALEGIDLPARWSL